MFKYLLILVFVPFLLLGQQLQSFDTQIDTVWLQEYRSDNATDSTSNIVQTLDTENQIEGDGCMRVEYIAQNAEDWGGFVKIEHMKQEAGSYDWSAYDSISFWYNNITAQDQPGRIHLRFNLSDNSDVSDTLTDAGDMEFYYSFHYILDNDPGWNEIKIPLIDGRGNPAVDEWNGEAFNRTGWNGPAGNDQLDKDFIKGFSFEFSIDAGTSGGAGETSEGVILFDNLSLKGSQNALSATGFEQGAQEDGIPVGWGGWQSAWDGWGSLSHITTPMSSDTAYEGDYYAELGVDGGNGYAVIYQSAAANPGEQWKLSSFIRDLSPADPAGDFAALKIEAKSGSTILKEEEIVQEGVTSDWREFTHSMIMPEGTDTITAVLVATKWLDDGIAAVYGFDNVTLLNLGIADTLAPEAPTGIVTATDVYFNQIVWQDVDGESGETYTVYASTSPITNLDDPGVEILQSAVAEEVKQVIHYLFYPLKDKEVTYYYAVTCTDESANTSPVASGESATNTAKGIPTISLDVPDNVVLDGDLSEWEESGIMPFVMSPETHYTVNPQGGVTDADDLSATVYLAVDDDYLYIAADVIDDVFNFGEGNWWEQDALEYFIGLYDSRKGKHKSYQRDSEPDYKVVVTQQSIFREPEQADLYVPEDTDYWYFEAFNPDYAFEAKISLDSIGIGSDNRFHPMRGMRIPFELYFHDNDGSGHEGNLAYSPLNTDQAHNNPQEWGYTWIGDTNQVVVGIEEKTELAVNSYQLKQNYPNPFNPETTIEYSIAKTSNVKISIFNIVGQELEVLVNTKMQAGNYKTVFNGSRFASGIYFYKIEAGNFTDVRKMLIVK